MIEKSVQINGKKLIFQAGKFAHQAGAAVSAQMGETIVLATVVSSSPRDDIDYFPLYVEYQEKLYAGGKIKGSRWVKREGRPSDEAILTARLIDRSIRPLFPKDYKNEVQVIITVLSVDGENDPDILAICAVSAALSISDIPWNGPVGAVRVSQPEGLNLVVSATEKDIVMVEAGTNEIIEKELLLSLNNGLNMIKKIIKTINVLQKEKGKKKQAFEIKKIKTQLIRDVKKKAGKEILELIKKAKKDKIGFADLNIIKDAVVEDLEEYSKKEVGDVIEKCFKDLVRENVLKKKVRIDGRKNDQIRKITIEASVLPRTHGSAIFQRGLTQALTITTLGPPSLEQWIENMEGEETKRYIHHYYMPPFSVGETGRVGWPSRREVGHGALAERALEPVIPSKEKFPYTIRLVSEIMSCNGSSSMASVCGSSLSLMDAGVPIKKPVAGIAMGLIKDKDNYAILTDILGMEDHIGDMDFKVAGTKDGITALQMDVKSLGINLKILTEGLNQAKKARISILDKMKKVLPAPRSSISKYAPKVAVLQIDKEKIGEIIGPGGKIIRKIIAETGSSIDVDDDGKVTICGVEKEGINKAITWIEGLTREVQAGEEFEGEVKRIQPFGAFVQILPGKDGLVHVSKMSTDYVNDPHEVVKVGQKVKVKVVEIDNMGRVNLTMLFGEDARRAEMAHNNRPRGNNHQKRNFHPEGNSHSRYQPSSKSRKSKNKEKFSSLHFKKKF